MNKYERKDFPAFTVKVDDTQGIVESIVSVLGNIDLGDDVIHTGAFTKTISERMNKIKVLDNHNSFSVLNAVGKPLEIREITKNELPQELLSKYPMANGGLYTKTQYAIDTPEGLGTFKRIKADIISEYSIGFSIPKGKWDITEVKTDEGKTKKVRNIREVILYEYSPVLWGMNDATMTLDAKGEHKELSLMDIEMKVMKAFNELHMMPAGEPDEYGYQEMEGYRCGNVYETYLLCRPHHIESEYEYYKVTYTHNDDYSEINFANQEDWQGGNFQFVIGAKDYSEINEFKAGRMISSANMDKLHAAMMAIQEIINAASSDALDNSDNNISNVDKSNGNTADSDIVTNTPITNVPNLDLLKLKHKQYLEFIKSRKY